MIRSITPVTESSAMPTSSSPEASVPAPRSSTSPRSDRPTTGVLGLLAAGVPLTLLFDLMSPAGPDSAQIYQEEYDAEAVRLFA